MVGTIAGTAGDCRTVARALPSELADSPWPEAIKSGHSLREQLEFARYLEKRATDPSYTFREHLRKISGAIEE